MKYAQLPYRFDVELLKRDLETAQQFQFQSHYNQKDFEGSWTSISLRSEDGDVGNVKAFSADGQFRDTKLLALCKYFQEVLSVFECEQESVRLLKLSPGSVIKEHSDLELGYNNGRFRIHIPICTNPNVTFHLDGELLEMKEGSCWYGDFNLPHRVSNLGSDDRVHLVIDNLRNLWSDALFKRLGFDFEAETKGRDISEETKQRIIEELETHNTPEARALIREILKS